MDGQDIPFCSRLLLFVKKYSQYGNMLLVIMLRRQKTQSLRILDATIFVLHKQFPQWTVLCESKDQRDEASLFISCF